jgi:flavin-dependent dehydrogenase
VLTSEGRFTAPVIVDCSGWRGALVNDGAPAAPSRGHFSFGLETRTALEDEGLSFWLDGSLFPRGLGWIFPVGTGSLIGLGSYVGLSKLKPALERFLLDRGAVATTYHGTYFPHRLFRPTVGRLFAVGDAAGQCLPLTAEGIRPALYFGVECGRIVQQIFDSRLSISEGLERYCALVDRYRRAYRILRLAQWAAEHAPTHWFVALTGLAGRHPVLARWWPRYGWFGRFDPDPATAA